MPETLSLACKQQGGARQLRHLLQEKLEAPLAELLLQAEETPETVTARPEGDGIRLYI